MTTKPPPVETEVGSLMANVLALDLVELTEELARNAIDLPAAATMVQRDFKLTVRSFLALTVTVDLDAAPPVTLTLAAAPVEADDVSSAFSLCLSDDPAAQIVLTCYAGQTEYFDELATDLALSLHRPRSAVDLDPLLPLDPLVPGLSGLEEFQAAYENRGVGRSMI
ncbi:hypothetical protein [uncultured Friedmanniella sp.]|uniref:hypothetical protein n=1 Tax=uncultured Friedmanniella sp. TaxID=335381 RepID=UPI0035C96713